MTTVDTNALLLAILAIVFAIVAIQSWRLGDERRDVLILTGLGAAFGLGSVAVAILTPA